MKTLQKLSLVLVLLLSGMVTYASEYKIVFELTSEDKKTWGTLLNNLDNVRKELGPKTEMEVVAHGNGIGFLLKKADFQKDRMQRHTKEGIRFLGCENTMKRKEIARHELYDFAGTVPAGLAEIIKKQKEGWAYIKIGH